MASTDVETGLITAEQLLEMPIEGKCELVDGRIVRMTPAKARHTIVVGCIIQLLAAFVAEKGLNALVSSGEGGYIIRRDPDTVRAPDVAYLTPATIARAKGSPDTFVSGAPDLAVEVLSPSDSWSAVEKKVADYLDAGSRLVWVVDPETERVCVYAPDAERRFLAAGDDAEIDGGEVIPGFEAKVAAFFG